VPAAFRDAARGILQQFAVGSPGRESPLMHTGRDSDGAQHTRIIDEACRECVDRRATVALRIPNHQFYRDSVMRPTSSSLDAISHLFWAYES
jgi:hypothetical protein